MGCGLWAVGCGLWAVGCGLWAVGCGLWAVGCGLWAVGCGLWAVGCGLVGCGLWAVGCGLWAVGCGLWAVGCGQLSPPVAFVKPLHCCCVRSALLPIPTPLVFCLDTLCVYCFVKFLLCTPFAHILFPQNWRTFQKNGRFFEKKGGDSRASAAIVERVEALMMTCRAREADLEQARSHAALSGAERSRRLMGW